MNTIPPRERSISLTAAPIVLDVSAQWISCITGSETFRLSINDGPDFSFFQGAFISLPTAEIRKIVISQASGAAINPHAITLLYGVGEFRDARLSLLSGASIRQAAATVLSTSADVVLVAATNTILFAANTSARVRRIRNKHATVSVRISSSDGELTAGLGEELMAGEVWESAMAGEIRARSTGTPTLGISEETF